MHRPARHDSLVARLVADAQPVRRIWAPALRLGAWAALAAVIAVAFSARNHLPGLAARLAEPLFAAQVASLAVAAVWCAWLAFRAGIPGREPRTPELLATLLLVALLVVLALSQAAEAIDDPRVFVRGGLMCSGITLGLAALPWVAALATLRRGAPVTPRRAAALAAGAALFAAAAAIRTTCPLGDERWHLLAWHLLPIAAGVVVSTALAPRWIRRWRHEQPLHGLGEA